MEKVNGSWIINGSMKADGESKVKKNFRLKVKFDNVPVEDVVMKSLEPVKIQWVNGQGRPNFNRYGENELVEINFIAPARAPQVDPEEEVARKMAKMNKEEQEAYIREVLMKNVIR